MISSLRGTVLAAGPGHVVVEVGGVGFFVFVPGDIAHTAKKGQDIQLHTNLIVRDDALSLYGFADAEELEVFQILLGVTGVGPKSALGVLAHLTVEQIAQAVADDDDTVFRRVSGIGPKTAKLITLQLAGKIHPSATPAQVGSRAPGELIAALTGLGWPEQSAGEAAQAAFDAASEQERGSVALLLRRALALLGPAERVDAQQTPAGKARRG